MKWRHKQGYYISWFFLYQQLCWLRLFFSATKWIWIDDSSNMKLMTSQCSMRSEWRHFHTLVTIENTYRTDAYKLRRFIKIWGFQGGGLLKILPLTDSSRGLKSVCKFKICKNFAKILHRGKFFCAFCNIFAIFLQIFFNFFNFFFKKRKELEVMNLSFNSLF